MERYQISATPTPTLSLLKEIPGVFALVEMRRIRENFAGTKAGDDQVVLVSRVPEIGKPCLVGSLRSAGDAIVWLEKALSTNPGLAMNGSRLPRRRRRHQARANAPPQSSPKPAG
jgi:hypothetical protein